MKILITTQIIDTNDPILGFFHSWLKEFSKNFERVTVVCLKKGEFDLPENVEVLSLGKEGGVSKIKYIFNFYKYIFLERKNYDVVFVHMNEEYVLLGGVFWNIFKKKVVLWRNHKMGTWKTKIAGILSKFVCYTSPDSFTAKFKNSIKMPVGIDDNNFRDLNIPRQENSFLYVGRISPIKNIDKMVEALNIFYKKTGINFSFNIVGPADGADKKYLEDIKNIISKNNLQNMIKILQPVSQEKLAEIYSSNKYCFNLTPSGSFDKTIWESVFCGCVPIVQNKSFLEEIPNEVSSIVGLSSIDPKEISNKVENIVSLDLGEYIKKLQEIGKKHSLKNLISELLKIL